MSVLARLSEEFDLDNVNSNNLVLRSICLAIIYKLLQSRVDFFKYYKYFVDGEDIVFTGLVLYLLYCLIESILSENICSCVYKSERGNMIVSQRCDECEGSYDMLRTGWLRLRLFADEVSSLDNKKTVVTIISMVVVYLLSLYSTNTSISGVSEIYP